MSKNIVIGILVVVILGGGYLFYKQQQKVQSIQAISPSVPTVTTSQASSTMPSTKQISSSGSGSCGTDMDCFIAQANTCGPSKVAFSFPLYGHTITANYAVSKTATSGMCSFTDSAYGTKQVCSVPSADLVAVLKRWKGGTFDSGDLSSYACTTTTSDGASFTTSPTSGGAAVSTSGYTYTETEQVGGSMSDTAFSYSVLAIGTSSVTMSFTNNQTNETGTVTAQLNTPVVVAGYTITLKGITEDGATFTIKE